MYIKGLVLLVAVSLSQVAVSSAWGFGFGGYQQDDYSRQRTPGGRTSWWKMMSCVANQVPKLQPGFDKPLYQYLFETFARNTHLLPLGVPINSKVEDFDSTAKFEECLWGETILRRSGAPESESELGNDLESKEGESSAYHQIFASRQDGYDSLTGFSLLGGKMVAAFMGYIIYALTSAT